MCRVYCAIEHLNNWGQNCNVYVADKRTTALILFNSKLGIHTWKISAVIKATVRKQSQITKSREAAYEDATGCRYRSIRELTVILPPRTIYD